MELTALKCCLYRRIGASGYAAPIYASPFRADRYGLSSDTFPRFPFREIGFILVWAWALLQSSSCPRRPECPARTCVRPVATGRLPWGFLPLRGVESSESTYRQASRARLRSVHSVSHALDGLLLAEPCRLVSSCYHVQDSRFRGLSLRPSRTTSSVARPSSPLAPSACRRLPDDASRRHVDLEVLIRDGIRSTCGGVSPIRHPVPSCDSLLRASLRQS
jgi:hypothetical protein